MFAFNPVLAVLGIANLTTTGSLTVSSNVAMTTMVMAALTTVTGDLSVMTNALTNLSLAQLTTVTGDMTVSQNLFLRQCLVDAIKQHITTGPTNYTATQNSGTPNVCP